MKMNKFLTACMTVLGLAVQAHAWTGPVCYLDKDQLITLTLETYAGEKAGELQVQFEDNEGEVELVSIKASASHSNSHEVVLRHTEGRSGIVGVKLYSPLSQSGRGPTYEFEFRKGMECNGAIIESELTVGTALSTAIEQFNAVVQQEKPWGAYTLTEAMVRQSIKEQLGQIAPQYSDEYQTVLAGRMTSNAQLTHFSGQGPSGRYFFIRLQISRGTMGYSLRVGKDAQE